MEKPRDASRALAALFDFSEGGPCGPHSALGFLRDAARGGELNYFEWSRDGSLREMDFTPSSLQDRCFKSSTTLDGILDREVTPRSHCYGLNVQSDLGKSRPTRF